MSTPKDLPYRHFVLAAPFRKCDVTIFTDRDFRAAVSMHDRLRAAGTPVAFITSTGTLNDLNATLRELIARNLTPAAA